MTKTAVGLFQTSAMADSVVALLLASGFSRDEVKRVQRSDFDAQPAPETDILKIGGVPADRAGFYWDAVRSGGILLAITAGDRTDRAVEIMDAGSAVCLQELSTQAMPQAVRTATASTDPGFYPSRQAAQLFEVS